SLAAATAAALPLLLLADAGPRWLLLALLLLPLAIVALVFSGRRLLDDPDFELSYFVLAVTIGLTALQVAAAAVSIYRDDRGPHAMIREVKPVKYQARASLDGSQLRITEEVTLDPDPPNNPVRAMAKGWQLTHAFEGKLVYRRERVETVERLNFAESEVRLTMDLGVTTRNRELVPADGSTLEITAPKGALGTMEPPASQVVDVPQRREMATVQLEPSDDQLVISVRPSWLRNPAGRYVDPILSWGPWAWLFGILVVLVVTVVVGKLTTGADSALGRLLRRRRTPPPGPPSGGQAGPDPAPRRLPGGGAGLLVRRPRRGP
ncbi:hypothetical protein KBX53_00225, partial [Micromonospora sp. M51]|uniref:hypothetical protein n=1 Tax=Micromonospora sp. M51 TaxID=2824889 RepID=UPI001B386A96